MEIERLLSLHSFYDYVYYKFYIDFFYSHSIVAEGFGDIS